MEGVYSVDHRVCRCAGGMYPAPSYTPPPTTAGPVWEPAPYTNPSHPSRGSVRESTPTTDRPTPPIPVFRGHHARKARIPGAPYASRPAQRKRALAKRTPGTRPDAACMCDEKENEDRAPGTHATLCSRLCHTRIASAQGDIELRQGSRLY